jgi:hypothetical protein
MYIDYKKEYNRPFFEFVRERHSHFINWWKWRKRGGWSQYKLFNENISNDLKFSFLRIYLFYMKTAVFQYIFIKPFIVDKICMTVYYKITGVERGWLTDNDIVEL